MHKCCRVEDPTYEAGTERSHVAHLIKHAEEAAGFGVTFKPPRIDIEKLRDWKKSVAGRRREDAGRQTELSGEGKWEGKCAFRNHVSRPYREVRGDYLTAVRLFLSDGDETAEARILNDAWAGKRGSDSKRSKELARLLRQVLKES